MIKKILKIICIAIALFFVYKSTTEIYAAADDSFYFPTGINYLNPDNFSVDKDNLEYAVSSLQKFRIKPATIYRFYSIQQDVCQISFFNFTFYDFNGEIINGDFVYEVEKNFGRITSVIFETPPSAHYISVHFDVYCMNPKEAEDFTVDTFFMFKEGANLVAAETYQGANGLYPVINHGEAYYEIDYDDFIAISALKDTLRAIDETDGDITHLINIAADEYTDNAQTLGTYPVIFSVSDLSGNTAVFTVYMVVLDRLPPVIEGTDILLAEPNELLSEEYLLGLLTAYDDYDADLTPHIEIIRNDYIENYDVNGIYQVEFQVADFSGNIAAHIINIDVMDRTPPVITGPSTISKPNNTIMNIDDIVTQFTAYDNIDDDITDLIVVEEDNYSLYSNQVGIHLIVLSVSDWAGNSTEFTVEIEVYDATAPTFFIDINKISVDCSDGAVKLYDLIDNLSLNGKTEFGGIVEIISDEYTGKEKTPGKYTVVLRAKGEYHKLEITVNEAVPPPAKAGFFEKIINFFKDLWKSIKSIFGYL